MGPLGQKMNIFERFFGFLAGRLGDQYKSEHTRFMGEYMQKHIPNCTLRIIENVGHCPHLSAPSASADAMEQFIAGL